MNNAVGPSFEIVFLKKVFASSVNNARNPPLFQLNTGLHISVRSKRTLRLMYKEKEKKNYPKF